MTEHKEHIKAGGYVDMDSGAPSPHCATCSKLDKNLPNPIIVPWNQIHQDWQALRDYLDLIEPELVELRKLRDSISAFFGPDSMISRGRTAGSGRYELYRSNFPNSDPRQ